MHSPGYPYFVHVDWVPGIPFTKIHDTQKRQLQSFSIDYIC